MNSIYKTMIAAFFILLFIIGCVTREYIVVIQGDGNTITVKADVPTDIDLSPDTVVSVIP